ncbi:MAG: Methyltransferase type 11 [Candidatus Daviesbacteria bacterium GW2011_GWA2_42_7]|uniref:Methyltransferase type 11 n=1 Tax=Candidatus Daviesbacteria bacterium GW2011_GWA2_42_7 TaxID=1618425 RepID=A0A0G1B6G1_9BACT|nr:MAG: Methyltransferase type 11 [Candidatus Daviesbacteria bacterium GW2011_GWA2_42_7]
MRAFGKYIGYLGRVNEGLIEQMVLESLPKGKDSVYLDLGCGDGVKTLIRASHIGTGDVIGIEGDKNLLSAAKNGGIKTYWTDINLPWPINDVSVDCITATEVVEHLSDLDNFFSESKRILNLSKAFPVGHKPCSKFYQGKNIAYPHLNVMTTKALRQLLSRYGFKVKGISGIGFYPLLPFLANLLASFDKYHASYCVVVAEK